MSPIPGDPGSIRTWATTYGGIADTIVEASSQLQSLELGEQTSIAVIEYHDNAQYLGENIALTEPATARSTRRSRSTPTSSRQPSRPSATRSPRRRPRRPSTRARTATT